MEREAARGRRGCPETISQKAFIVLPGIYIPYRQKAILAMIPADACANNLGDVYESLG